MKKDLPEFTKVLNDLLYVRNMTIKDLAKEMDLPYTTFYYQVTHPSALPESTVNEIEKFLGISPRTLSKVIENGYYEPPEEDMNNKLTGISRGDNLTITIPFVNQKLSAGTGEDYLSSNDISVKTINISDYLARGVDRSTLLAAEVRGDSMIDEKIYPGDIVIFSRGLIMQEGIYVINYASDVLVKKLAFDALKNTVDIISGNRNYPTRTVDADSVAILGKVVGWIHRIDF